MTDDILKLCKLSLYLSPQWRGTDRARVAQAIQDGQCTSVATPIRRQSAGTARASCEGDRLCLQGAYTNIYMYVCMPETLNKDRWPSTLVTIVLLGEK